MQNCYYSNVKVGDCFYDKEIITFSSIQKKGNPITDLVIKIVTNPEVEIISNIRLIYINNDRFKY